MTHKPHFGHTETGLPVHRKTLDYLRHSGGSWVTRFNARLAVIITRVVGSMWCAYAFAAFDLISLPAALRGGSATIVSWVAQTFLQLVLLSIIMVGQDVQAKASDARSEKNFEDTEKIVDLLDVHTSGGLADILAAVEALSNDKTQFPEGD